MDPSYSVHTLYPDILVNDYSIIHNKELKDDRDTIIMKYINCHNITRLLSCNEFDNIHANIIKFVFDEHHNIYDVNIVIALNYHKEEKMCFLISKSDFIKCRNTDAAIRYILRRHRNDFVTVNHNGGSGKFVLIGD